MGEESVTNVTQTLLPTPQTGAKKVPNVLSHYNQTTNWNKESF